MRSGAVATRNTAPATATMLISAKAVRAKRVPMALSGGSAIVGHRVRFCLPASIPTFAHARHPMKPSQASAMSDRLREVAEHWTKDAGDGDAAQLDIPPHATRER